MPFIQDDEFAGAGAQDAARDVDMPLAEAEPAPAQGMPSVVARQADAIETVEVPGLEVISAEEAGFEGDVRVDSGAKALSRVGGALTAAGSSTSQTFMQGFAAMRDVARANKEHAEARDELNSLRKSIEGAQATLDHRLEIERNFDMIVAEQTSARNAAQAAYDDAQIRIDQLSSEHDAMESQLEAMRADHAEQIRPYKNLMDSTKGRADDAGKALSEARRAVRAAESAVSGAISRREQRIASANRAVDNAAQRLERLTNEFESLSGDPSASANALDELKSTVAGEQAHLDAARAEVTAVTEEAQRSVAEAQSQLTACKSALEQAEVASNDAKAEAAARKEEHDRLRDEQKTAEARLESGILDRETAIRDATKEQERSSALVDEAQALLDEANDIHSTPEVTRDLQDGIARDSADAAELEQQVNALAQNARDLKAQTRTSRTAFIGIIVGAIVLIALIVWLIFFRG